MLTDQIIPLQAPEIPGLSFRHFRGESDSAAIAAVLTASEAADQVNRHVTAEDIANAYQHLNNCEPFKDIIIAEVSGEMVGYARGWWETEGPTKYVYKHNGFIRPEWRRKGIGRTMLTWIEERLRSIAATHPVETEKYFQVSAAHYQISLARMFENAGYQPIRYFYSMVRPTLEDIPDYPLPAGLELRPVTPDQYPALWKSADEISKDEWGYTAPTEADYQAWLNSPQFQPQLWQVAWESESNQTVGHVLTYIHEKENEQFNRRRGYTEGIGVDRNWRRRGVARALISHSLRAQKAAGMTESALVADSDSTSNVIQLYQSCGFQIVKRDTVYRKPLYP